VLLLDLVLIAAASAFAYSLGAHYTGACMGMPYAAGAIRLIPALLLMAPFVLVGAVFASGAVETTVGHGILLAPTVAIPLAVAIVVSAFVLTAAYNFVAIPTSTIQILVFSAVGAGLASGVGIHWSTIETLVAVWAAAPFAACGLGFALTRLLDRWGRKSGSDRPGTGLGRYVALVGRRHDDDRDFGERGIAELLSPKLPSVHHRHHQIQKDERGVNAILPQAAESILTIVCTHRPEAFSGKKLHHHFANGSVVLHHHHRATHHNRLPPASQPVTVLLGKGASRKRTK